MLATKTTQRLLGVLLGNALSEFKEIDLIARAGTGKGSARDSIADLVKRNVLEERRVGKTKMLSLNIKNQSVFLLKALFDQEKMGHLSESKKAAIFLLKERIKEHVGLFNVFGSCIAGTATEKSDIDLLIVTEHSGVIVKERKKIEELFGEQFNIHFYTKDEIKNEIKKKDRGYICSAGIIEWRSSLRT